MGTTPSLPVLPSNPAVTLRSGKNLENSQENRKSEVKFQVEEVKKEQ